MEEIYIHNGNEFSRAQVEDAAFEKGITVEEYLAKYGVTLKDQVPEPEPEPELEPQKKPTLDLEAVGKKGGVAGQTVADVTPEVSATDTDLLSEDTLSESQKFVTADLFSENEEEVAKELNGLLATYGGYIKESGVFQNGIEVLIGEEPTFEGKFVHGEEQYLPRSGKLMTGKKTTPEQREENARILNSFLATYGDKGYLDSALADGETMEMVNDFKNKATVPASGLTNEQIMFDVFEKFEHYVDRENSIIELEQKERVGFMTDEQLTNELEAAKKAVSKQLVFKDEKEEERYKKFKEGGVIPDFTEEEYEEMRHEKKWKKYDEVARDYSYDLSQEERNKMHAVLWSEKNEVDKTRKKFETDVDEHVKKTDTLEKRIQDYKDNPTSYELYKEVKELQLAFIEESNRLQEQQIILQRELKETEFLPIAIKDFGSNYRRLQQLGTSFKSLGTDIAYSILQIGQLTGFGQPAAAVHAVSKWSLTPEQRNKALDESTGIITMRERMNVETESYQRSIGVDEIKTLSDLGRWTASSTTNLIPSLAMAFTGPAALPLFALSGWGSAGTDVAIKQKNAAERMIVNKKELVENPDMDMIRKVELENQMDEDSKILKISNWEQLSLQALYGVSEVVFERLGTMSLIKGARAAIRSLPPATVKEGFEFAGKQLFKGITVEGGSEFGTTIAQNFGDIYILGEDKNIFEDSLESFAQGALMGAGITSVAGGRAIKHTISSELATRAEDRRMREIVIQLRELTGITSLQNIPDGNIKMPNQSPEVQTLIAELTQEKENITNDIIAKLDNGDISIQQAYEIGGINRELRKIGERYNALMHDKNLSPQQLEAAEKELGQQYEALKEKRENILTDPSILKENQDLAINDNIRKDWEMGNSMYSMRMSNNTALNLLDQWGGLNNSVKQGYYEEAKKALRKGAEKYKRFSEKEIQDKAVELYIEKSYRRKIEEGERNARTYATTRGEDLNIYKGETIEETIGLMKTHGVMESIAESLKKQILEEGGKPPSMEEL
ncbi:hypothetical protein HOD02_02985, partial [bacterium]|nr:hypothetical protein [bacterium]